MKRRLADIHERIPADEALQPRCRIDQIRCEHRPAGRVDYDAHTIRVQTVAARIRAHEGHCRRDVVGGLGNRGFREAQMLCEGDAGHARGRGKAPP